MCRITLFPTDAAACSKLYTLRLYQKSYKISWKSLRIPAHEVAGDHASQTEVLLSLYNIYTISPEEVCSCKM